MAMGIVGLKAGMTRVFDAAGQSVPVTVIHAEPNRIVQTKEYRVLEGAKKDFFGVQVAACGPKKASKVNRALAGHYRKAEVQPAKCLMEFKVSPEEATQYTVGQELTVAMFAAGQKVDVTGTSKGKGFAGTVKRYHFRTQDMTHGNSRAHRVPGSTGQNQTPGRVFPGKKMAGHLGDVQRTIQSLEVVRIDEANHLILVKGGLPGAPGGRVVIKPSVK